MKESKLKRFLKYNLFGRLIKVVIFPFGMLIISIMYIIGIAGCLIIDSFDSEKDWLLTTSFNSEISEIFKNFNPKF